MFDFSHLLHLYLGQILSWKVQKCGVSSTLSCHYDPRQGKDCQWMLMFSGGPAVTLWEMITQR